MRQEAMECDKREMGEGRGRGAGLFFVLLSRDIA
jgi:hypothetical protein